MPKAALEQKKAADAAAATAGPRSGKGGASAVDAERLQSTPSDHVIAKYEANGTNGGAGPSSQGYVDEHTGDVVIASLGPGDFFGETGLLEGRSTRGASVVCRTPVEVMAMRWIEASGTSATLCRRTL